MTPDLRTYDVILANSSAGKDSQAMLDVLWEAADEQGVSGRIVVVHADLGRVEWPGTKELAASHAECYGLRFEVVRNPGWADLLERIEARGQWPDMKNRYCTSEFKTGQVRTFMTKVVREVRTKLGMSPNGRDGRPVRILNALGLRAQESPKRAKMVPFEFDKASSNGRRHVDQWLPIHDWKLEDVWRRIEVTGVPHHPAYDLGMPRLSCVFCVFASKPALLIGAKANPELAQDYADAEIRMGHTFRQNLRIADVVEEAKTAAQPTTADDWSA